MRNSAKHAAAYISEIVGAASFLVAFMVTSDPLWALVSGLCLILVGLE